MKQPVASVPAVVFNVIFSVVLIFFFVYMTSFIRCFAAAERLPTVLHYPVMRLLIYGTSGKGAEETVSATVTVLDTAGNECVTIERSWRGSSLSVDFVSAEFSGKKMLFPHTIYGRHTVSTRRRVLHHGGTDIASYYLEEGRCRLLGAPAPVKSQRDAYTLARFALNPLSEYIRGFSHRYTVDLSRCQTGEYYAITTGTDGALTLATIQ